MATYAGLFAAPGDPEYEPEPDAPRPASPRRFRNPELAAQARVDAESRAEKCALCAAVSTACSVRLQTCVHLVLNRMVTRVLLTLVPFGLNRRLNTRSANACVGHLPSGLTFSRTTQLQRCLCRNLQLVARASRGALLRACRKVRVAAQRIARAEEQVDAGLKEWDPAKDPEAAVRPQPCNTTRRVHRFLAARPARLFEKCHIARNVCEAALPNPALQKALW